MMETPDLQAGASRQGVDVHIVPPDPAKQSGAWAHSGQKLWTFAKGLPWWAWVLVGLAVLYLFNMTSGSIYNHKPWNMHYDQAEKRAEVEHIAYERQKELTDRAIKLVEVGKPKSNWELQGVLGLAVFVLVVLAGK